MRAFFVVEQAEHLFVAECKGNLLALQARHIHGRHNFAVGGIVDVEAQSGGASNNFLGVLCHVDGAAGFFHVENADAHEETSIVHTNSAIVGATEEEVAVKVVDDLVDGAGVASQVDRLHGSRHFNYKLCSV